MLANGYDGVENSLQILEILLDVVGKDKEFFRELTNQEQIPKEVKEFLDIFWFLESGFFGNFGIGHITVNC